MSRRADIEEARELGRFLDGEPHVTMSVERALELAGGNESLRERVLAADAARRLEPPSFEPPDVSMTPDGNMVTKRWRTYEHSGDVIEHIEAIAKDGTGDQLKYESINGEYPPRLVERNHVREFRAYYDAGEIERLKLRW